jgi:hypothetical protein
MRGIAKIISALLLGIGILPVTVNAGTGGGVEAFEKLKALAGHWETAPAGEMKATLDIQVTSGGSVVMEIMHGVANGRAEDMVTMYYLDGDQVKMTHYCMAGNQPTMRGTYDPAAKTLTFEFVSATNMKTADDGHMHHAVYTFVDNDHLKTVWTFQKNQKNGPPEEFAYVRTK